MEKIIENRDLKINEVAIYKKNVFRAMDNINNQIDLLCKDFPNEPYNIKSCLRDYFINIFEYIDKKDELNMLTLKLLQK
jgi:hypothetical protein